MMTIEKSDSFWTKNRVLTVFKEFHVRVERHIGRKWKAVQADNGGEYRGQLEEYYRLKGIRLEFTLPKMLKLKEFAKRMN